jgi:16S rRNA G527 N7-methylase RsmG
LERFVSLAAPLLADGGRMIAMKGRDFAEEVKSDESRVAALGFEIADIIPYTLPLNMGERNLIVITARKTA